MKKMLASALALSMLLLAGCGDGTKKPEETDTTDGGTQSAESTAENREETTTEFTGEASYVLCGYAKDVVDLEGWDENLTPPYETFVADESEHNEMLAFMKNEGGNITDFKLYKLEYVETPSEELPHFKAEEIYHRDTLSDIDPVLIKMTFFGTIPNYGISFVDEYGMKSYALTQSGEDGSLVMPEIVLEPQNLGAEEGKADVPAFVVSSIKAKHGQQKVAVTVSLKNNPGIASIAMSVAFSSELTLDEIGFNSALGGQATLPAMTNPVKLLWVSPFENHEGDGAFATLYFNVSQDASGELPISISYDSNDVYNLAEENLPFETVNGKIVIE